jgi:hypothetical protein
MYIDVHNITCAGVGKLNSLSSSTGTYGLLTLFTPGILYPGLLLLLTLMMMMIFT